ncbi:MAG: PQQ-like beta-propeller repeat protein [Acidobacteria bacterium]|nr:PQQ-like beta-propeller repeat protein [Acidobacteriota bacterium]
MKKQIFVVIWLQMISWVCLATASSGAQISYRHPHLRLITAVNIPTSFLTDETVYADQQQVYLAGYNGRLYVLDRSRRGYPVRANLALSSRALRSVRGDSATIYVTSDDGNLYSIDKHKLESSHASVYPRRTPVYRLGLESLYVGRRIIVSTGSAEMTADPHHVYVAALNAEPAFELSGQNSSVAATYEGSTLGTTSVYDQDAQLLGTVLNPTDLLGRPSAVNLLSDGNALYVTIPGCCGTGIAIYDARTLSFKEEIPLPYTNVVSVSGNWLVAGTESGTVDIFDLGDASQGPVASINLREITGHTGPEDIEVRSIWVDWSKRLVFAASSWGNDTSRGPDLPSFFVLSF